MKAVLISIQPKWCERIANGSKTIEVRKTKPKLETPFKVYIYCTNNGGTLHLAYDGLHYHKSYIGKNDSSNINGKVIGEFVCNNIDWHGLSNLIVKEDAEHTLSGTCLTKEEVLNYLGYQKGTSIYACKNYDFYGWHISNLVIYDKPRELSEFYTVVENEDCGKCQYYDTPCESEPCNQCQGGRKYLTRPPQSWCYVESEVQGE